MLRILAFDIVEKLRIPHVFIIYQDGLYMDYSSEFETSPSKNFTLSLPESITSHLSHSFSQFHQPDSYSVHMGYANNENIYIFYGDGKKPVTYIDIQTQIVRAIPETNLGDPCHIASGVRVGDKFLMACDRNTHMHSVFDLKSKSNLWSDRKQRLIQSPYLTATAYTEHCLTSLNRYKKTS